MNSIFDTFATRDDFYGFGYIGGRRNALEAARTGDWPATVVDQVAEADAAILARAGELGWSEARLFKWANSKDGRWFTDYAFGCDDLERAMDLVH